MKAATKRKEEEKEKEKDTKHKEGNMKLIKDLWGWLKEWNDWGMKDWIKAGIIVVVVLFILYKMTAGGA